MKTKRIHQICQSSGKILNSYNSIKDAARNLNIGANNISKVLRGDTQRTKDGYQFIYDPSKPVQKSKCYKEPVWLPQGLVSALDQNLKAYPPNFKYSCKKEYFYWLLSVILTKYHVGQAQPGEPVKISLTILRQTYSFASDYFQWLIEVGMIVCHAASHYNAKSGQGYPGEYSIPIGYLSVPILMILLTEKNLVKNVRQYREGYGRFDNTRTVLIEQLDHFTIADTPEIALLMDDLVTQKAQSTGSPSEVFKVLYQIQLSSVKHQVQVYNPSDEFGHRFHTNITNLKKDFRNFLILKDSPETPLVEIDISNSQFYFLSLIFEKLFIKANRHLFTKDWEIIEPEYRNNVIYADVENFKTLTRTGRLYEYLMQAYGTKYLKQIDRHVLKQQLFKEVLFFKNYSHVADAKVKLLFEEHFPQVWAVIRGLKSRNRTDDKDALCRLLQRLESYFVLDVLAYGLISEYQFPVLTVHDALICPKRFEKTVREYVQMTFADWQVEAAPFLKSNLMGHSRSA